MEAKVQRGGKLGGSSGIMRIFDYLVFWLEKFHLNLSKSPHALGERFKVQEERGKYFCRLGICILL